MALPGNTINQLLSMGKNNNQPPKFDKMQLKLAMHNLNNQTLSQLVQKARTQGIQDSEIESGLNFLFSL